MMKIYLHHLTDLIADILGSFILGIGIYCFMEEADIAPGGISGICIMLKYLLNLPVGIMNLILNIPLLVLAWKYLGHGFTKRTFITVIIDSIILDWVVTPLLPQYAGDRMLSSIFGGLCAGAGMGIILQRGSSTAGTDIVSYLLEKKFPHISIGRLLMIIDCIILGISMLVFGNIESGLFGAIALFCQTQVIDGIIYGIDKGKTVIIMSSHSERIAARILLDLHRGTTYLSGYGGYTNHPRKVLLCVIRAREFYKLKRIINAEDPRAFLIVQEATQIIGEGFKNLSE